MQYQNKDVFGSHRIDCVSLRIVSLAGPPRDVLPGGTKTDTGSPGLALAGAGPNAIGRWAPLNSGFMT